MSDKAIRYAEDTLGAHEPLDKATAALGDLKTLHTRIGDTKMKRRIVRERIADREVDVYVEVSSTHPESSKTAIEAMTKNARQKDPQLTADRGELDSLEAILEHDEYLAREHELTIKISEARMIELGGYFNYLAVTKFASLPK
jgi:hypothetical protein